MNSNCLVSLTGWSSTVTTPTWSGYFRSFLLALTRSNSLSPVFCNRTRGIKTKTQKYFLSRGGESNKHKSQNRDNKIFTTLIKKIKRKHKKHTTKRRTRSFLYTFFNFFFSNFFSRSFVLLSLLTPLLNQVSHRW